MPRKKTWFEKKESQRAFLIALLVAMLLLAIEAIRYVITLVVDVLIFGANFGTVVRSYGYAISLGVAILLLYVAINKTKKSLDT